VPQKTTLPHAPQILFEKYISISHTFNEMELTAMHNVSRVQCDVRSLIRLSMSTITEYHVTDCFDVNIKKYITSVGRMILSDEFERIFQVVVVA
jgi:hypothetical protein